jgi:hypothetical protein
MKKVFFSVLAIASLMSCKKDMMKPVSDSDSNFKAGGIGENVTIGVLYATQPVNQMYFTLLNRNNGDKIGSDFTTKTTYMQGSNFETKVRVNNIKSVALEDDSKIYFSTYASTNSDDLNALHIIVDQASQEHALIAGRISSFTKLPGQSTEYPTNVIGKIGPLDCPIVDMEVFDRAPIPHISTAGNDQIGSNIDGIRYKKNLIAIQQTPTGTNLVKININDLATFTGSYPDVYEPEILFNLSSLSSNGVYKLDIIDFKVYVADGFNNKIFEFDLANNSTTHTNTYNPPATNASPFFSFFMNANTATYNFELFNNYHWDLYSLSAGLGSQAGPTSSAYADLTDNYLSYDEYYQFN